jgi:hypothetical protein
LLNYIDSLGINTSSDNKNSEFLKLVENSKRNDDDKSNDSYRIINAVKAKNTSTKIDKLNIITVTILPSKTIQQTTSTLANAKKRYIAYDGGGFGTSNDGLIQCSNEIEIQVSAGGDDMSKYDIAYFHMNAPPTQLENKNKKTYKMVFTMESEV